MARASGRPLVPRSFLVLSVAAGLLAAGATPASAALAAERIRIGSHPGHVRVVVDFSGGRVEPGEVVASDPDPFRDGRVALPLTPARGVVACCRGRSPRRARPPRGPPRPRRPAPVRPRAALQVRDLFRPPRAGPAGGRPDEEPAARAGAAVRRAPDGCLTLSRRTVTGERVRASGRARGLFENALVVRLRDARGRVVAEEPVTAAAGRWRTSFRYRPRPRQAGTLEAVALSAEDGTLDCLVQSRVRLGG